MTSRLNAGSSKSAGGAASQTVTVELGDKPKKVNIIRDGNRIPSLTLDDQVVDRLKVDTLLDKAKASPRVVFQSIKAGTRVPVGASVDIVLIDASILKGEAVPGGHRGLTEASMAEVADLFLEEQEIRDAVAKADDFSELPEQIQKEVLGLAEQSGLEIQDDVEDLKVDALYRVILTAQAYT